MTLILDLTPTEEQELSTNAAREGVSLAEYARRRLLAASITDRNVVGKPFNIVQFAAAAPRSLEESEAHVAEIAASRAEWDERDWRQMGASSQTQP